MGRANRECSTDSNLDAVISRVAVLPQPPLLVPELVGGDDPDASALRTACVSAARSLAGSAARWAVVGAGPTAHTIGSTAAGTFRGFGVDVRVTLGPAADTGRPDPAMALPGLVAGWLRAQAGAREASVRVVPADLAPAGCAAAGRDLAAELAGDEPVGLLVLGDGSHRHGDRSVGRPDERAEPFDRAVAAALAAVDLDALAGLDAGLAAELGAVGRAPWQVLAAAARADGRRWVARESALHVPFGVAYHVAVWEPA